MRLLSGFLFPRLFFSKEKALSDPPKLSIGHPCFLFEGVPPQPNYPPAAVLQRSKGYRSRWVVLQFRLHASRKMRFEGSHLRSATRTISQQQAVVKLHGVFVSHWKISAYSPSSEFTRFQAGTAGESLCHSCKPPIKRRGITLPQATPV